MGENETEKQRRCQSRFVAGGANWKWKRHGELEADRDCQGDLICLRTENTQGSVVIGDDSRDGDAGGTWWSAQILCGPIVVMSRVSVGLTCEDLCPLDSLRVSQCISWWTFVWILKEKKKTTLNWVVVGRNWWHMRNWWPPPCGAWCWGSAVPLAGKFPFNILPRSF